VSAAPPRPDPRTVRAAVAAVAAVIERVTSDLALGEEPARFVAPLEGEPARSAIHARVPSEPPPGMARAKPALEQSVTFARGG
jgi:hypothetical protein